MQRFCSVLCLLLCLVCGHAAAAGAERTVRVGFFAFEGFQETLEDGHRDGYGYQYLRRLAQITGWKYEYVDASWSECLAMLERGEIDLLGSVQRTPERERVFAFPKLESGTNHVILYTRAENATLSYEDFAAFQGIRVGLLRGSSRNDALRDYGDMHGFTVRTSVYDTEGQLMDALDKGEVDAVLTSSLRKPENRRVIARFAPSPFYFVTRRDDTGLMEELNKAQEAIKTFDPYYDLRLYDRYYLETMLGSVVFSSAEQAALEKLKELRVAFFGGWEPLASYAADGPDGVAVDVFGAIARETGLRCTFVKAGNHTAALEMVRRGEADAVCFAERDERLADEYGMVMTQPYMQIPVSMISRTDRRGGNPGTIAIPRHFEEHLVHTQMKRYPGLNIVWTDSPRATYEALLKGKADFAYTNIYSANFFLMQREYAPLISIGLMDYSTDFSIGVSRRVGPEVVSALDKVIAKLAPSELPNIIVSNTSRPTELTLSGLIQARPLRALAVFVGILVLMLLVFTSIIIFKGRANKRIRELLYFDRLTGLWNLSKLVEEGQKRLSRHRFALVYIDIDDFKYINDMCGYAGGDEVLKALAAKLLSFVKLGAEEIVAKIAADHFVLLLRYNGQEALDERIRELDGLLASVGYHAVSGNVVFSCGICIVNEGDTLVEALDHAHYAKDSRRRTHDNAYTYFTDGIMKNIREEKKLEEDMAGALERGDFVPYFQPKVDMVNGELVGAEALVRWVHPDRGLIPPSAFIPLFERNGFIVKIDFRVYEETCRFLKELMDGGRPVVPISCNFSRIHFLDPTFPDRLYAVVRHYGVPAHLIDIELTETIAMGNTVITIQQVTRLRELGFLISIDDFGTGYSSLSLLCKLDMDMLKLDKVFLDQAQNSPCSRELIEGLIQMAGRLGITVLCEGVETEDQAAFLKGIGCTLAQGYLYDRPLPKDGFLRNWIDPKDRAGKA